MEGHVCSMHTLDGNVPAECTQWIYIGGDCVHCVHTGEECVRCVNVGWVCMVCRHVWSMPDLKTLVDSVLDVEEIVPSLYT